MIIDKSMPHGSGNPLGDRKRLPIADVSWRWLAHSRRRATDRLDGHYDQLHLISDKRLAPTSVVGAVAALRFLDQITLKQPWAADAIIPVSPQDFGLSVPAV